MIQSCFRSSVSLIAVLLACSFLTPPALAQNVAQPGADNNVDQMMAVLQGVVAAKGQKTPEAESKDSKESVVAAVPPTGADSAKSEDKPQKIAMAGGGGGAGADGGGKSMLVKILIGMTVVGVVACAITLPIALAAYNHKQNNKKNENQALYNSLLTTQYFNQLHSNVPPPQAPPPIFPTGGGD